MVDIIHLDRPVRFTSGSGRVREAMIQYLSRNADGDWGVMVIYGPSGAFYWVSFDKVEQDQESPHRPHPTGPRAV